MNPDDTEDAMSIRIKPVLKPNRRVNFLAESICFSLIAGYIAKPSIINIPQEEM